MKLFLTIFFFSAAAFAVDMNLIEKQLTGDGVHGWIHGSVDRAEQFVFTYRTAGNFFDHAEFPLITFSPAVRETLGTLGRHDEVTVQGKFFDNKAPIKHIQVSSITLVKKYVSPVNEPTYQYKTTLPQDLQGKTELLGLVHAIANDGHVLVIEYKDAIVPVVIEHNDVSKNLYRNDKIRLKFKFQAKPNEPSHLVPDTSVANPLTVVERVADLNGKPADITGNLVLFPQSPEILFNVFALEQVDSDGIVRDFTLLNMEDPDVFTQIRTKLQKAWDSNIGDAVINGRNKLVNTHLKVHATGTFNEIDPGQANAQVILASPDAVTIVRSH